jgi:hypothetical protein
MIMKTSTWFFTTILIGAVIGRIAATILFYSVKVLAWILVKIVLLIEWLAKVIDKKIQSRHEISLESTK